MKRFKLAAPILLVYWLMLLGGLGLYAAIRVDDASMRSLWLGALTGTVLGHGLALLDLRATLSLILVFLTTVWLNAVLPGEMIDKHLWLAFVPAAMCAFFSLGDRGALAAFWFPAVIWMLSILDRTGAQSTPDRSGIVLLGGIAVLFIVFLRIRESRRVKLWQGYATVPLADAKRAQVLREQPGRHLARAAWIMTVGSVAFAVTAWLAPELWRNETFEGQKVAIPSPAWGKPCCPIHDEIQPPRARVKEYFDLGRGHQTDADEPIEHKDCRVCDEPIASAYGATEIPNAPVGGHPTLVVPDVHGDVYTAPSVPAPYVYGGTTGSYDSQAGNGGGGGVSASGGYTSPSPSPSVSPGPAPMPNMADARPTSPSYTPQNRESPSWPQYTPPPQYLPPPPPPTQKYTPPAPAPTQPTPPPPPPQVDPTPPAPVAATTPVPTAPTPPMTGTPPEVAPSQIAEHRESSAAPSLLHWIALLVAAGLILQVVALALRPVRRALVLRHLRSPFWQETVDQRVSNAWQLALVGLRDAGWTASTGEQPREFAGRVGVAGMERCAVILERARHGLGIDATDLAEMNDSAGVAYRSARAKLGPVAKAASWLRWPLA